MHVNVAKEVATLKAMSVSELRVRYTEVFGIDIDNEGTGRNGPAILPGPGISIGRKTQVCTPKGTESAIIRTKSAKMRVRNSPQNGIRTILAPLENALFEGEL